jgi:hypothetical protein
MKKNGFMAALATSAVLLSTLWPGWPGIGATNETPLRNATHQRDTLHGLRGVHVLVERLEADVECHGLTSQTLQADTEEQLRRAGIEVLAEEQRLQTPGTPYLYVNVNVSLGEETPLAAVSVDIALKQSVVLARDPVLICLAPTWRTGTTGRVGCARLADLRGAVKDLVAEFVEDYHAVNAATH